MADAPWKQSWAPRGAASMSPTPSHQTANSTSASSSPAASPSSHCYAPSSSPSSASMGAPTSPPYWGSHATNTATPTTPTAFRYPGSYPPLSPGSSQPGVPGTPSSSCSGAAAAAYDADCDADEDEDSQWETRSATAHLKSLQLLEEAVANGSNAGKSKREKSAQLQALHLFDQEYNALATRTTGRDVQSEGGPHRPRRPNNNADDLSLPHLSSSREGYDIDDEDDTGGGHETVADCKSDIDIIRQRGANLRALSLLHVTAAGERYQIVPDENGRTDGRPVLKVKDGGKSARQAAIAAYELRQQEKARVKARMKHDQQTYGRPVPKLVVPIRKETLAESTRKKKPPTPDDVKDPETVSGMKCRLHWDREKEAQSRALKLLNEGFMI